MDGRFALRTREVIESESGVRRDTNEGKTNWLLVFDGPMLRRWADLLTKGVTARGRRNWMNAATEDDLERFRESAARHFAQWVAGETDEDHAAAVIFNINGAEFTRARLREGR